MFIGKTFQKSQIAGPDGKLNKTCYRTQTAEDIERDCSKSEPCLVWYAWFLRGKDLVLLEQEEPILNTSMIVPNFSVVYACPEEAKKASEYLSDVAWVQAFKGTVKGVSTVSINDDLKATADSLAACMLTRLTLHVADRVDASQREHFTIGFTRDNIASVAAGMCLSGHIVSDIDSYRIDERLLVLPVLGNTFKLVKGRLAQLEGCYLYFDQQKTKWIRSGKTSGNGKDACFAGRGKKHKSNARSKDQMRMHRLYREYPARGFNSIGAAEGTFDNLAMYCGMAYDKGGNTGPLTSVGAANSLYVWSKDATNELNKKGDLSKLQDAVAYLWELCYDLLLGKSDNVSTSPGFEALGLRVNSERKRKRDE